MKLWWLLVILAAAIAAAFWQGASISDLIVGLASGVLAAWVWAVVDINRRRWEYRTSLRALEGTYRIRKKGDRSSDFGTVTLTMDGMVLHTCSAGVGSAAAWEGEIRMAESLPTTGSGPYRHTSTDGWGIHTVQVRGRELLVHAEYVRGHDAVTDAYVWKPTNLMNHVTPNRRCSWQRSYGTR